MWLNLRYVYHDLLLIKHINRTFILEITPNVFGRNISIAWFLSLQKKYILLKNRHIYWHLLKMDIYKASTFLLKLTNKWIEHYTWLLIENCNKKIKSFKLMASRIRGTYFGSRFERNSRLKYCGTHTHTSYDAHSVPVRFLCWLVCCGSAPTEIHITFLAVAQAKHSKWIDRNSYCICFSLPIGFCTYFWWSSQKME